MKVSAKDVYSIVRGLLGPELKSAGFRRLKMAMPGWTRPYRGQHFSLWFQCDRWGWFQDFGSRFTIEFQIDSVTGIGGNLMFGRERFMALLTMEERELVRSINNRVLRGIPALDHLAPNNPVLFLNAEKQKWFTASYQERHEPYELRDDTWLHYRSPSDVSEWCEFFTPRIVRMIAQFEQEYPREYAS